jgi:hypothetical protein
MRGICRGKSQNICHRKTAELARALTTIGILYADYCAERNSRKRYQQTAKSGIHLRREGVVGKNRFGGEAEGRKPAQPSIPEGILGFPSL